MGSNASLQQRFDEALEAFVAKAREDPYIIAVILFGSLAHDRVWEKSDIDLMLVGRDETGSRKSVVRSFAFLENGVNIHAFIQPRSAFKKMIEGSLQSSFMHASFAKSKLLFTRDETLRELYKDVHRLGTRDQKIQCMRAAGSVLPSLYKAQKWLHVRGDADYAFLWTLYCANALAPVEVFLAGQIAGREVIQQALELNPQFFKAIYSDLIHGKKTAKRIGEALDLIDGYLFDKHSLLFQPIIDYLREAGAPRSVTEIETHFKNHMNAGSEAATVCEWLADKDVILKISTPVLLTEKSSIHFEEMAFCYDGAPHG